MAAPKLNKEQQKTILRLLSEGEPYQSIADQVGCTLGNVKYYAVTYGDEIEVAREEFNKTVINQGFANKEYRIRKLNDLALRIQKELDNNPGDKDKPAKPGENGLYVEEVKISSTGQVVRYDIFNRGMVAELRGLADDIAKELGDRKTTTEITGNPNAPFVIKVVYGEDGNKAQDG